MAAAIRWQNDSAHRRIWGGVLLLALIRLVWIGDESFIHEEAKFIHMALDANERGDWLTLGNMGKMGARYGPATVWFYRALLAITHDIYMVAALSTATITSLTLIGLRWLARSTRLHPMSLIPVMLSPYLFYYSRKIWDGPFTSPLILISFSTYLLFLETRKTVFLFLAFLCASFALQFHLMALAFVAPLCLHFLFFEARWAWKNKLKLAIPFVVLLGVSAPYGLYLLQVVGTSSGFVGGWTDLHYAFLGARYYTTFEFSYVIGDGWQAFKAIPWRFSQLIIAMSALTWLAFPISWFGAFHSAKIVKDGFRWNERLDLRVHASLLAWATFGFHAAQSVHSGLRNHPNYYSGAWIAALYFLMLGITELWSRRWFRRAFAIYCAALAVFFATIIVKVHVNHGTRNMQYGPTLSNQDAVARQLNRYLNDAPLAPTALSPKIFPHAIGALRRLDDGPRNSLYEGTFDIRYATDDWRDGSIEIWPQPWREED